MSSALVPLAVADGWVEDATVGYYIHQGYVYLEGTFFNDYSPLTRDILASPMPSEARPPTPLAITINYVRNTTDWVRDPALVLPTTYAATVGTDGTITLDADPPPQVSATPSAADYFYVTNQVTDTPVEIPRYVNPLNLELTIAGIRWALPGTPPMDTFSPASLAAYLAGGDFEDIDSSYVMHGTRVHFAGTVRAISNGARELLTSLPADATDGLTFGDSTMAHRVSDGRAFPMLNAGDSSTILDVDTDMNDAGQPGPVDFSSPGFQVNHQVGLPYTMNQNYNIATGPSSTDSGAGPDPVFLHGYGTWVTYGHGENGDEPYGVFDFGNFPCGPLGSQVFCPAIDTASGTLDYDIDYYVNSITPAPDFFALFLALDDFGGLGPGWSKGYGFDSHSCVGNDCPVDFVNMIFSAGASPGSAGTHFKQWDIDFVTPFVVDPDQLGFGAFIAPDDSPEQPCYFTGSTGTLYFPGFGGPFADPFPGHLLWRGDQLSGTMSLSWAAVGIHSIAGLASSMTITPFWVKRQDGLRAGDVISLDGAGWPGNPPVPVAPAPGNVSAGPLVGGTVRMPSPDLPRGPLLPNN